MTGKAVQQANRGLSPASTLPSGTRGVQDLFSTTLVTSASHLLISQARNEARLSVIDAPPYFLSLLLLARPPSP